MSTPDSQEKNKSPEQVESGERTVSGAEQNARREAESSKDDYYESITKQARALKKARVDGIRTSTHEDFGTPTIDGDDGTLIRGGAPGPATLSKEQLQQRINNENGMKPGEPSAIGSAENTGKVIDYKIVQESKTSFSLGMDYEDDASTTRNPIEKLGDFMQAATRRASDPEGWKSWAQGEIDKFAGIGAGLNEAKEETKAAVAAGLKALTDGTVVEFLSQPNAINAPVFKTVANAFDAMSKDPNAVNKAFEALGHVVMKASEGYSNLPDHEKGKVIGKVMFFMVNPEGSTEGAEAAARVADHVATHVDTTIWNTIEQAMKAMKDMAPDLAAETKQALYDFIKETGLSGPELEAAGVPRDYFASMNEHAAGDKGDNFFAISKAEVSEVEAQALAKSGKGGKWRAINERPSPDVVKQTQDYSCSSACGEMLSNSELKQSELIDRIKAPCSADDLAEALGPPWKGARISERSLDVLLNQKRSWAAELRELQPKNQYKRLQLAHTVVVDGLDEMGNIMIRDPADGTRYEMTRADFINHWNLTAVYRSKV